MLSHPMLRRQWIARLCLALALLGGRLLAQPGDGSPASPSAAPAPGGPAARAGATAPPTRPGGREEMSPAEVLAAYEAVRDQLRATQSALLSQRIEADERFRAHSRLMEDRLQGLTDSLAAVNRRQAEDASRVEYELFRQQEAAHRSNRIALWVAATIAVAVLLGTLLVAHGQRRAMNRIADAVSGYPRVLAQAQAGWVSLEAGARSELAVDLSGRRLDSALERIEQRVRELEHTTRAAGGPRKPPGSG